MIRAALLFVLLAAPALAQERQAEGARLRVLDRMTDQVQDLDLRVGTSGSMGRLTVTLDECRYPEGEPAESIAHLTILDGETSVFSAWVSAASPALNALDHPRYDAWLLSCDVPDAPAAADGG